MESVQLGRRQFIRVPTCRSTRPGRLARWALAAAVTTGLLAFTPGPAAAASADYRLGFGDTLRAERAERSEG